MSWKVRLAEAVTIVVSRHPDEMADLRPGWSEAHRVEGPTKINCCRFVSLYALKAPALTGVFYCFNRLTSHQSAFNTWHYRPHLVGFLLLTDIAADRCYDKAVALCLYERLVL